MCFLDEAVEPIARTLLVVIWHVLTARAADRKAHPELVAFKFMAWSWKLNDTLSSPYQLGGVFLQDGIIAYQSRAFNDGLRNQQSIERVFMMVWQGIQSEDVIECYRQHLDAISPSLTFDDFSQR